MYSNCCSSCSFEREIIKIDQSSHKMYINNVLNFQESTTTLNACTKKSRNLLKAPHLWHILSHFFLRKKQRYLVIKMITLYVRLPILFVMFHIYRFPILLVTVNRVPTNVSCKGRALVCTSIARFLSHQNSFISPHYPKNFKMILNLLILHLKEDFPVKMILALYSLQNKTLSCCRFYIKNFFKKLVLFRV